MPRAGRMGAYKSFPPSLTPVFPELREAFSSGVPARNRPDIPSLFCLLLLLPALNRLRDLLVFFCHLGEAVPSQILRPRSMPLRRRLGIILAHLLGIVLDRHVLPHEDVARLRPHLHQSTLKSRCRLWSGLW